jgi:hypothetical protein
MELGFSSIVPFCMHKTIPMVRLEYGGVNSGWQLNFPAISCTLHAMRCPACGYQMRKAKTGKTTLDTCPKCKGIWFDSGLFAE